MLTSTANNKATKTYIYMANQTNTKKKVIVLGSGALKIGQALKFAFFITPRKRRSSFKILVV